MHTLAVELQPHAQVLRVFHLIARDKPRADGAKSIVRLALGPLAGTLDLEFTLRKIIHHAIARHMLHGIGFLDVLGLTPDDDAQFHFPIRFFRFRRNRDRVIRAGDAGNVFGEDHRFWRHFESTLGGVVSIVEANGDEFLRTRHTSANARLARHQRQLGHIHFAQFGKARRRNRLTVNVFHDFSETSNLAMLIQNTRLFFALGAIT